LEVICGTPQSGKMPLVSIIAKAPPTVLFVLGVLLRVSGDSLGVPLIALGAVLHVIWLMTWRSGVQTPLL